MMYLQATIEIIELICLWCITFAWLEISGDEDSDFRRLELLEGLSLGSAYEGLDPTPINLDGAKRILENTDSRQDMNKTVKKYKVNPNDSLWTRWRSRVLVHPSQRSSTKSRRLCSVLGARFTLRFCVAHLLLPTKNLHCERRGRKSDLVRSQCPGKRTVVTCLGCVSEYFHQLSVRRRASEGE